MKTDNAYSATTIDGVEVFVRKIWDGNYKELRSNEIYKKTDLKNFISLSKIMDVSCDMSIPAMIQVFHASKYKEYYFHSLYIADIAVKLENNVQIIEENRILYKKEDEYIDLHNYDKYNEKSDKIIMNEKLFIDYFSHELLGMKQPRNKILKLYKNQFQKTA